MCMYRKTAQHVYLKFEPYVGFKPGNEQSVSRFSLFDDFFIVRFARISLNACY